MSEKTWDLLLDIAIWFCILTTATLTLAWEKGKLLFLLEDGVLKYMLIGAIVIIMGFIRMATLREREGKLSKRVIWASILIFLAYLFFFGMIGFSRLKG